MASTINVTLTGVSDQIAAAVADSLEPHRITDKAPEASNIGEELGKSVANALNTALAKIKSSALSASFLREQILANFGVIFDQYNGSDKGNYGITTITIATTGTEGRTEAALLARDFSPKKHLRSRGSFCVVAKTYGGSDIDALSALHEKTKLALGRATSLSTISVFANQDPGQSFVAFWQAFDDEDRS